MSFKTLYITNPCKLSISKSNLLIEQGAKKHSVHIKDIASIMIETNQATITTAVLEKLSKNGIVLLTIDSYYLPTSITLPLSGHSLYSKIVHQQLSIKEPLKKRVWQKIVSSKIENQAKVLEFFEQTYAAKRLYKLSKSVSSGDSTNQEAKAAKVYWEFLFDDFVRRGEGAYDIENSALNYGYAVVRSMVARSVVLVGLSPVFGVFHKNYFNSFNLVDDLIEPFRAFVDMHIKYLLDEFSEEVLTTEFKARLIDILNMEFATINSGVSSLKTAIHTFVSSYQKVVLEKDIKHLKLPTLDVKYYELNYECI